MKKVFVLSPQARVRVPFSLGARSGVPSLRSGKKALLLSCLVLGGWSWLTAGCASVPPQDKPPGLSTVAAPPAPVAAPVPDMLALALNALLQDRQRTSEDLERELHRLDELPQPAPLEQLRLAQGLLWLHGESVMPFRHEASSLLEGLHQDARAVALAPLVQWLRDQALGWGHLRAQRDQLAQQLKESQARVEGLNNKIQELKAIERNLVSRPGSDTSDHYSPRH